MDAHGTEEVSTWERCLLIKGCNVTLYVVGTMTKFPLTRSVRLQEASVSGVSTVVYCLFSSLALLFDCVKGLVSFGTRRMARCT